MIPSLFLIDDNSVNDSNKTMIRVIDEATCNENESREKPSDVHQSTDISSERTNGNISSIRALSNEDDDIIMRDDGDNNGNEVTGDENENISDSDGYNDSGSSRAHDDDHVMRDSVVPALLSVTSPSMNISNSSSSNSNSNSNTESTEQRLAPRILMYCVSANYIGTTMVIKFFTN